MEPLKKITPAEAKRITMNALNERKKSAMVPIYDKIRNSATLGMDHCVVPARNGNFDIAFVKATLEADGYEVVLDETNPVDTLITVAW